MAIRLEDEYPGRTNPADANYPDGSFKNETTPGSSDDGTPLEQAWQNDMAAFFQGLLSRANITPSGNPDTIISSQILDALESQFGFSPGHINGLETEVAADADHDITIGAGSCRAESGLSDIRLSTAITKRIDAAWAEGDNLGGLASSVSLVADATYHLFVISKPDGTVDAGWDTSLDAANLLSDAVGYDSYRRVFSNITDGSANIIGYSQNGDWVEYSETILDYTSDTTGTARVVVPVTTPSGVNVQALITGELGNDSGGVSTAWMASKNKSDVAPTGANRNLFVSSTCGIAQQMLQIETTTTPEIAFRNTLSNSDTFINVRTNGYIDIRGK